MTTPASPNQASPRLPPMLTLGLVCIAVCVGSIDLTVVTAVLPKMLVDLNVSIDTDLNHAAWIITGYLLTYTISLALMGRLSDLLGRRRMYFVSLTIFIIGSAWIALAPTLNGVILGRVIQAFGAGAVVPIAMALVGDLFSPARRAPALGFVAAVETLGWMIGHLYGGVLMRFFNDWRLLFWINVPVGLLALAATWWALRDIRPARAPGRFDWWGALLVAGGLIALNVGLSAGGETQTDFFGRPQGPPPYALPLVGLALVLLAAFVWLERRIRDPLVDLLVLGRREPLAASVVNGLFGFALAIALANVPLFIHTRLELFNLGDATVLQRGAWESGWMLSALTLTMAAVAVPGGWLVQRAGPRWPTLAGMATALVGFGLMSGWQAGTGYPTIAAHLLLTGAGLGLVLSPVATVIINAAGDERHGSASALVITLRLVGMTVGVSVLTLWGVQRQDMLRRAGTDDPLARSDPALFLMQVAAQVIGETFLFAAGACLLALLVGWALGGRPSRSPVNSKTTHAR